MRIVFCDDETALLELYQSEVDYAIPNQEIHTFSNGHDAVAFCRENKVDLVFTDGKMPKMDGLELAKSLQSLEHPPQVILVTGYVGTYEEDELEEIGISKILNKPIDYDELITFIQGKLV